jgi:hypothetical protein
MKASAAQEGKSEKRWKVIKVFAANTCIRRNLLGFPQKPISKRGFSMLRQVTVWISVVANCSVEITEYLNKKIKLDRRVASANQAALEF